VTEVLCQSPGSLSVTPWTAWKRCRHIWSLASAAGLACVELNWTEPTIRPGEVGLTGAGRTPGMCEHAAVKCLAVASVVFGASWTVSHC